MRVLLAAGQADLRLSLELLLSEQPGVEIVGSASEGDGLQALIHTSKPEVIVTDWELSGRPVPSIIADASHLDPHPRIIVLTRDNTGCQTALGAGADAAVLKGSSPNLLLTTFESMRSKVT